MSAPQLSVFLPSEADGVEVYELLVAGLSLKVDVWLKDLPPGLAASAQAGPVTSYVLIERYVDSTELIEELVKWERPAERYKSLLAGCVEHISVTYRDKERVRTLFAILGAALGSLGAGCIIENGEGCLLTLQDVQAGMVSDPLWQWDRQVFAELPDVAPSEWLDA